MKRVICLALLLLLVSFAFAQTQKVSPVKKSPLQSMIETEFAFAKMSLDQGTRPAFMAFIADDGVLFRPRAVKGKQWMTEHPVPPPSDKRALLSWYPAVAEIALAGDMGYTTGPWEFKQDINDAAPVGWGTFLTVWKKQADGTWKFAIDLGISNPKPEPAPTPWQLPANYKQWNVGGVSIARDFTKELLARDREFSQASATVGAAKAFVAFSSRDVLMFRGGKQPLGKADAESALLASPAVWTWKTDFADASKSHDLGYTYGTYQLTQDAKTVESGNYYRIWKHQRGQWIVVADLLDRVAEEKKN
ncbi:MAG TPA: DUF4440 domain-containing protein [Pyrinomonadaceae bacterium]|jgi:ketosteroid isomerase-like protein